MFSIDSVFFSFQPQYRLQPLLTETPDCFCKQSQPRTLSVPTTEQYFVPATICILTVNLLPLLPPRLSLAFSKGNFSHSPSELPLRFLTQRTGAECCGFAWLPIQTLSRRGTLFHTQDFSLPVITMHSYSSLRPSAFMAPERGNHGVLKIGVGLGPPTSPLSFTRAHKHTQSCTKFSVVEIFVHSA